MVPRFLTKEGGHVLFRRIITLNGFNKPCCITQVTLNTMQDSTIGSLAKQKV